WTAKPEKIEWFALTPKFWRCNLTDLSADQVGFVANAAPRPAWIEFAIDYHDSVLPITKIDNLFDPKLHCGSVRLRSRAVVDGKVRETPVMELRRFIGSGFRAALRSNLASHIFSAAVNCHKPRIPDPKPISVPIAQTS